MKPHNIAPALFLFLSTASHLVAQSSASYSMDRVSVTSGGAFTSSLTYEMTVVLGQESPAGASSMCNSGFRSSFGYWSVLGDLPVPIVLRAARNHEDPEQVDLSWSGADERFALYRGYAPQDVNRPSNMLQETTSCTASDLPPPAEAVVFYLVQPQPLN